MGWVIRNIVLLPLGLAVLVRVVVSLPRGEFLTKYGWVLRGESPGEFWTFIVLNTVIGVGLIAWQIYLWISP